MVKGAMLQTARHIKSKEDPLWTKVKMKALQRGITAQAAVIEALRDWVEKK